MYFAYKKIASKKHAFLCYFIPMFIHLIQVWNKQRRLLNSSYDFEKPLSMKHGNSAVYCTFNTEWSWTEQYQTW